jgi:hypothetical protein
MNLIQILDQAAREFIDYWKDKPKPQQQNPVVVDPWLTGVNWGNPIEEKEEIPAESEQNEDWDWVEDDSLIKKLILDNIKGFADPEKKSKTDLRVLSVHLFPHRNSGIIVTFVASPTNLVDWTDINNLFELKTGINNIMSELTRLKPQRKLYIKLGNYGPSGNDTWIPLNTSCLPELKEEFTGDNLYTRDKLCIGYAESFRKHKINLTKNHRVYEEFVRDFKERKKDNDQYPIFPTDDVIFTTSYLVNITDGKNKKTLEEISEVFENKLYGKRICKNGVDVMRIENFIFHSSYKYINGMFSTELVYKDDEFENIANNF